MAFNNVNISSLKNAIQNCKRTINYSKSKSIVDSISGNEIWACESKKNLKKAIEKLNNERYKLLEKKLDDYAKVVANIEKYKELEKENINLQSQYANLNKNLYRNEKYITTSIDSEGNRIEQEHTRVVKDSGVERQMNNCQNKIRENKQRMQELENKVANLV